ncbi:hypothetical protein Tco_1193975 [Tanacetum coccineum]
MDFESRLRQLKEKYSQETELRVNIVDSETRKFVADTCSQLDSSIQKHFKKREQLEKSRDDTLIEINKLEANLAQLETDLSDAFTLKEDILSNNSLNILLLVCVVPFPFIYIWLSTASHRQLSSLLGDALAELEPEKKKLQRQQAKVEIASSRKKHLSQQVPTTTFTKLAQAADETISAAKEEIRKLTQASQHLTDQVTDLQSQLESANLKWQEHMDKIISLEHAKSNAKSYSSELELVAYSIEIDNQTKEQLQEELKNCEAGKPEDDSEKTSIKRSVLLLFYVPVLSWCNQVPSTDITKLAEAETDATISAEQEEIRKVTRDSKHLTNQVTELQSKLKSGTLNLQTQRLKISQINRDIQFCKEKLTQAELDEQCCLSLLESAKYCLEMAKESKEHLLERQKVLRDYEAGKLEDDSEKTYIKRKTAVSITPKKDCRLMLL